MTALTSLNEMIAASAALQAPKSAAVVDLARTLAGQVDAAGAVGPNTRLAAAYLSVLKDLRRISSTEDPGAHKPAGRLAHIQAQAAATQAIVKN